jgi:hypothetical protein
MGIVKAYFFISTSDDEFVVKFLERKRDVITNTHFLSKSILQDKNKVFIINGKGITFYTNRNNDRGYIMNLTDATAMWNEFIALGFRKK